MCSPAKTRPIRPEARSRSRSISAASFWTSRLGPCSAVAVTCRSAISARPGRLDDQALVRPDADADLGEPRGVDADDVGRQDAGTRRPSSNRITASRGSIPRRPPSPPKWTGSAWSPPSQRYSSRGQPGPAGGRRRPADRAARQRAAPPFGPTNGQARPERRLRQPDRRRPRPFISSTVGLRPPSRTIAIDPPQRRGDLQRLLGRAERHDRDLVLRQRDRQRLLGVLQVDDLGDEPAAVDGVGEVVARRR